MSSQNNNRLGKFNDDSALEEKMRQIRVQNPGRFSVKKLAKDLNVSNHRIARVYWNILGSP